ncbi:MAG: Ger(x)C family spore germination protein [Bacillota bacterium]
MKRKIILIPFILFLFFVAGCWSRVELDQRAIVAGYGADKAEEKGKMKVTVQIVNVGEIKAGPAVKGGSPKAVTVYTGTGYTFFDAIRNLSMTVGKKIFLSETKIMVIGEDLAREGIGKVTDFIDRNRETSTRQFLLIAKGEAEDVLNTELGTEKIWAYGIGNTVQAMTAHGKAPDTEIKDFLKAVQSKTTAPVAPTVQVVRKGKGEGKAKEDGAELPNNIKVSGTAVFHHYKLVGWLNEKETRGLLWVTGRIKSGIIVTPAPESEGKLVAIEIIRASGEVKPEISDGNLTITVEVREDGDLGEEQPYTVDINRPGIMKELEERQKLVIEDEIRAAVDKAQELNADIFGFGEAVRRKYPKKWKQFEDKWDEIFPALTVNMMVDAKIRRTGKITDAAMPKP